MFALLTIPLALVVWLLWATWKLAELALALILLAAGYVARAWETHRAERC